MSIKKSRQEILTALKFYIPIKYWNLNDWNTIINRCREVEEGIYKFKCSFITLYFDENLKPVTYAKQYVIKDEVYYDLNKHNYGARTYTLLGDVNWENHTDWGL